MTTNPYSQELTPPRALLRARRSLLRLALRPAVVETAFYRTTSRLGLFSRLKDQAGSVLYPSHTRKQMRIVYAGLSWGPHWRLHIIIGNLVAITLAAIFLVGGYPVMAALILAAAAMVGLGMRLWILGVERAQTEMKRLERCDGDVVRALQGWLQTDGLDQDVKNALLNWACSAGRIQMEWNALQSAWKTFAPLHRTQHWHEKRAAERNASFQEALVSTGIRAQEQALSLNQAVAEAEPALAAKPEKMRL